MKPLIIGQAPARGNDGKLPFAGTSGGRLARLAGVGSSGDDLPDHFDLENLIENYPGKAGRKGDAFDLPTARVRAEELILKLQAQEPRVILLMGRKVERAFGWTGTKYLVWNEWQSHQVVVFPHPSGVNLWWNDVQNIEKARRALRRALSWRPKS